MEEINIKPTCRLYRGDTPCTPNKLRGKECPTCDEFDPIKERILLIKLGAPGDVLRTTALLPAIRRRYPQSEISWLTRRDSAPLLENLSDIDKVLILENDGFLMPQGEWFDWCINLDNDPLAASMANQVRGDELTGFRMSERGKLFATNKEARGWLQMACFDRLKKENTRSYQSIMRGIIGVPTDEIDPVQISLRDSEIEWATGIVYDLGMESGTPIAFNTGSGSRWVTKRWPMESFLELGLLLHEDGGGKIFLVGGPIEDEANALLAMERPDLFVYPGTFEVRKFMALLSRMRLIVTADTMALHVGLGLQVPTVALFGSTSAPEIESSGPLIKVISPVDCICCYLKECDKVPFCMDELTPDIVAKRIEEKAWLSESSVEG